MRKKYLVATHGELAKGFQSSLNILTDKGKSIDTINAYVSDEDYTDQIVEFIQSVQPDEQAVIFTDLFGGSVNQKVVAEIVTVAKKNIFVVSNANLAILLTLIVDNEELELTGDMIVKAIEESQVRLVPTALSDEEEYCRRLDPLMYFLDPLSA